MASPDISFTQMLPDDDLVGELTPARLASVLQDLIDEGASLRKLTRHERIEGLHAVCAALRDAADHQRRRMATEAAASTGWSAAMVNRILDDLLTLLSQAGISTLLNEELGEEDAANTFRAHRLRATTRLLVAPELVVHVLSGNVPTTAIEAMVLSLAAGVPALIRTSSRERSTARFFLAALRERAPELARHLAVVSWNAEDPSFMRELDRRSPLIVVHGSDDTINRFRHHTTEPTRLLSFGHRVSFGLIEADERLPGSTITQLAERFALDASLFEGGGCMSPQTLFVIPHPSQPDLPRRLARALAEEGFPAVAERYPRPQTPTEIAAAQMQQVGVAAFVGKAFETPSGNALCWSETQLRSSPGYRHVHVVGAASLEDVIAALQPYRAHLSTAGLHVPESRMSDVSRQLAHAGVRRLCPPGRMQRPVLLRAHDGRPRLRDWFTSCDREG